MGQVDRNRILEYYKEIYEFSEVVGLWEIAIEECPITLKIKVLEIAPNKYMVLPTMELRIPNEFRHTGV